MQKISINFNRLRLFVVLFVFQVIFYSFSANADLKPYEFSSNVSNCSYILVGKKVDGSSYNGTWTSLSAPACELNLNMGSTGLNVPDGVYKLYFKASDATTIPTSNVLNTPPVGEYFIDTTPPVCILDSFELVGVDNQYFNDGKLYYKSDESAKGKIVMRVSCYDTQYTTASCYSGNCVSGLDNLNLIFPKILGANPDVKKTGDNLVSNYVLTYNWSGEHIDKFDILSKDFIKDIAGNTAKLSLSSSSKVVFKKNDTDEIGTIILSSLRLWPDSEAPVISGDIKYVNPINGVSNNLIKSSTYGLYTYFAALNNRELILPDISDSTSGLASFDLYIENSGDVNTYKEYSYKNSTIIDIKRDFLLTKKFNHDFSDVSLNEDYNSGGFREYGLYLSSKGIDGSLKKNNICDMVGNCSEIVYKGIRVVANEPNLAKTSYNTNLKYGSGVVANYSDENILTIGLKDIYGNEVVPVNGVKNISFTTSFINNLGVNQFSNTTANLGDGVGIRFTDGNNDDISFNIDDNFKKYSTQLTQKSSLYGGTLKVLIKSAVPTYGEYITANDNPGGTNQSLYGDDTNMARFNFDKLGIKITSLGSYSGVGEMEAEEFFTSNFDFIFKPVLSFNYISNIYPIVEGQSKNMTLKNIVNGTENVSDYLYRITVGTDNNFLQIVKSKLLSGNISDGKWNISSKSNVYKLGLKNNSFSGTSNGTMGFGSNNTFQILPQTISGINDENTNVALYSTLQYVINGKLVSLPGIQTGFSSYGKHTVDDFKTSTKYMDKSAILFSEIDVTGITQTNNKNGTSDGTGAITTDNSTFNDFSTITLYDLKTNISKNVSILLNGLDRNKGSLGIVDKISNFSNFTNQQGLVLKGGDVLYVKDRDIEINCGTSCGIDGKKTIIIENGNLTINSNLYYSNSDSVLGIILIGNSSNGDKSKVKINENITNGVGIIYSDGPIVSVNNSGIIYDGDNIGTNLINQLYWKGSFITKNTVGGSISSITCPYGTPEYEKSSCTQEVAQRYDLIYLRRYARVNEFKYFASTNNPMGDGKVPIFYDSKDTKISGGRTIFKDGTMNSGIANLTKSDKLDAPLILDFDSKIQLNPPYGFEQ